MRSHLTRQVFRRLLANEPIVHRGCLVRRRAYHGPAFSTITGHQIRRQDAHRKASSEQRRNFFNFNMFRKPKREMKDADIDPGLEKMMELEKLTRMRARLPPVEEVAQAFKDFVQAKRERRQQPLEDVQARLALQALEYCLPLHDSPNTARAPAALGTGPLRAAVFALYRLPKASSLDHLRLAQALHARLAKLNKYNDCVSTATVVRWLCIVVGPLEARREILAFEKRMDTASNGPGTQMTGPIDEAEEGLQDVLETESSVGSLHTRAVSMMWPELLACFVGKKDNANVDLTLREMRDRGGREDIYGVAATMIEHSIALGDVDSIRHWWRNLLQASSKLGVGRKGKKASLVVGRAVIQALQWCLSTGNLDLGHQMVRDSMQGSGPSKPVWDAIFVWAAGTGKGVDEIGRMLDVMERSNDDVPNEEDWRRPDVSTINALVEFAISKDDPYMAERFIALGKDRGIEPDSKTYVLQMEYRLRVNDLDGALTAYKNLQDMDLSSDEDVPTVNKLITSLCSSKRHDFDTIMNIVADLSDRRARFEPSTVSTLSLLHLNRDEIHDVIDLLNTHAYHYSSAERDSIRAALVTYCLDPSTEVSRSWDAYTIIRNVFDELPREPRTELMLNFFKRDRPDMAVHVFQHMRMHSRQDTIPTVDTYVLAFLGCAKRHDLESLEVVHNQLKLDYNINLNTYLRNALIIGYTSCGRPRKALGFWDDIVASREGPTYNSIHIALRACERSPFGDLKAREIFEKLRKMNIELDSTLWASYIAALAGNGDIETAVKVLLVAEKKGELEVDGFVLGSLYDGTTGAEKQGMIERFAVERYPSIWQEVMKQGVQTREDEVRKLVGLDRSVTP